MNICPKCNGAMKKGFIIDHGDYDRAHVSTYQPGEPRRSIWTGIKKDKQEQLKIVTYRCNRCGYLENYANG